MLKELRIQNLAVVEDVNLTFSRGLNVLTGSTGAGKSLILGAVNLLRGQRAEARVIRKDRPKAVVAAVFSIEQSLDGDHFCPAKPGDSIELRREVHLDGRSCAFINGKQVPLKAVAALARQLIESHGQNEQLKLKSPDNHIAYVDMFAQVDDLRSKYTWELTRLNDALERLALFNEKIALAKEKRELLEHRIGELERANLQKGEKEALAEKIAILENCQNILEAVNGACELIYDGDSSAVTQISQGKKMIERLSSIDKTLSHQVSRLEEAVLTLEECAHELRTRLDKLEYNTEKFEAMQERFAFIQSLERRNHKALDEILEEKQEWQKQLESLDLEDEKRQQLEDAVETVMSGVSTLALELSERRRRAGRQLDVKIGSALEKMMLPGVIFRTDFSRVADEQSPLVLNGIPAKLFQNGIDKVEFFIRTNKGEKEGSVSEIASTGETSRIALALRDVLSGEGKGSVLIFDELDAGVGGDMGNALADKLLSLSSKYQIIAITHLPQIAAAARRHLIVLKRVSSGRTFVDVSEVAGEDRRMEIARMLGGSKGSKKRIALATEMLASRKKGDSSASMRP